MWYSKEDSKYISRDDEKNHWSQWKNDIMITQNFLSTVSLSLNRYLDHLSSSMIFCFFVVAPQTHKTILFRLSWSVYRDNLMTVNVTNVETINKPMKKQTFIINQWNHCSLLSEECNPTHQLFWFISLLSSLLFVFLFFFISFFLRCDPN